MNLKKCLTMLLIAILAIACKKENEEPENFAKIIEGSYNGSIVMSVSGNEMSTSDATVKLTALSDGSISVILPKAGEGAMSLPELTVNNVSVTSSDNSTYVLNETSINQDIYTGTLSGSVKDGQIEILYAIKPGAMPMSIDFKFTGSK